MRHLALAVAALAAASAAQTNVVVPSFSAQNDPKREANYPFFGHATAKREGRALYMYDTADIKPVAMNIKALQVRRSTANSNSTPNATFNIRVDVSVSPTAHTAASATFASNHGTNKANVFTGNLSLPSRNTGPWPRPWEVPVVFTAPFTYVQPAGKSLVIEIASTTTSTSSWNVEAGVADAGTRTTESSPARCPFAENPPRRPGSMNIHYPRLGMRWWMRYLRYPHNTPSFNTSVLVVGNLGAGSTWNGLRLPINIRTGLQLPSSSAGCVLATNIAMTVQMIYKTSATPTRGTIEIPRIPIPNDPSLGNQVIYSQPVSLDTDAVTKALKIHSGWANKHRIGTEQGPAAATVYTTANNAATTGRVVQKHAATLNLVQ